MTTRAALEIGHVEMAAQDAGAATQLLVEAFGAVEQQPGRLLLGTTPLQLHQGGSRRALSALGLRTDDLQGLRRRLSDAQVTFDDQDAPGGPAIRLPAQDWGGVPLVIGGWLPPDPRPASGDDNVLRVDHVGIASADNTAAQRRFCDLLGLHVESRQTDTETLLRIEQFTSDAYGVRVVTSQVGQTGLRVLFVSLGETDLELLQDLSASAGEGEGERSSSTAGDTTAISRYIERSGPGLHHLALRVRDVDAALLRAKRAGATLLDETGRPGSRGAQIAFLDPRSTARILFHFVQR